VFRGVAMDDVFARVRGRTWERAVAVNWVGRGETLVVLAGVVVAREVCRKRGVYAGSTTPDLMLVRSQRVAGNFPGKASAHSP